MVHPSCDELEQLKIVAAEIRAVADEAGFCVDLAVQQHEAFSRTRGPASSLERSLILDGARKGASLAGLWADDVSGGGVDIVAFEDRVMRRYRVKSGRVDREGNLVFLCGAGSSLLHSDPDALFADERWLLGYISDDDHAVERIVAAHVVDWAGSGSGPVRLVLGEVIELGAPTGPSGFSSSDEDLEGFEDEQGNTGVA